MNDAVLPSNKSRAAAYERAHAAVRLAWSPVRAGELDQAERAAADARAALDANRASLARNAWLAGWLV